MIVNNKHLTILTGKISHVPALYHFENTIFEHSVTHQLLLVELNLVIPLTFISQATE